MAVPHSGDTVGKYKLGKKLGEGAFGLVFIAHDTGLDRDVALKFLHPHQIANPSILERFLQEARSAAKLSHPGIVTVHELGTTIDGTAFIAMELLQGESLRDRITNVGRFLPDIAKVICSQVASALQVAHLAGVIHRDLKPDNIFLAVDPTMPGGERVKVLDFGIAKLAQTQTTSVQTGSLVFGTPRYMSPEQCRSSANVDHRTDIYALGCILYELVCGRVPFDGAPGELLVKHQLAPVPAAREFVPAIPHELDQLISRMLAKDPDHRPQTMEHVQRELATGGRPDLVRPLPPDAVQAATGTPATWPVPSRTTLSGSIGLSTGPARSRRTNVVVATSIALAGAVAGILVVTRTPDRPAAAPFVAAPPITADASHDPELVAPDAEVRAPDPATRGMAAGIVDASTAKPAETESPAAAPHLTPDSIVATVRSEYATGLQSCYERYAKVNRDAPRTLVVTLHVAMTGRVVTHETSIPMKECDVFESMHFASDAATDDDSRQLDATVTFDYPPAPARSRVARPARVPSNCPAGMVWKPSESACVVVPPVDKKKCAPIKDGAVDPFEKDPCRQ
jgi:serine/threonine-protein kinase